MDDHENSTNRDESLPESNNDDERGKDSVEDVEKMGDASGDGEVQATCDDFHADNDLQNETISQEQDDDALEDSVGGRKQGLFPEGGFGARVGHMDTKIAGGDINLNDDNMVEAYLVLEADRRR